MTQFFLIETLKFFRVEQNAECYFISEYSNFISMRRHRQIALLGSPGVGKSSLAHHFVYKQFHNVYDPNIKTSLFLFVERINIRWLTLLTFDSSSGTSI